jgi:outer membrane protein assembly factor BamB
MQWSKINKIIVLTALLGLVFFVCGCQEKAETSGTAHTSLKPQLELVQEKSLGSVAENKIPDVTKSGWSYGVPFTKPVVFPDGKYVLSVEEAKMTLIDTATGEQIWEKATYGGIDNYVAGQGRLYLTEKGSYGNDKEHSYIICLDARSGEELWKYDVQKDLAPIVKKYMPAGAKISYSYYLKLALFGDKLVAKGYTGWKVGENSDKAEVLLRLDQNGKRLWKVESHGYPGIAAHSELQLTGNKLVMGTYTYGDNITGPAYIHAFDINTGKKLWQFNIKHENELAYSDATDVAVTVVDDKVVGVTNYGRVYVLDQNGKKMNEFLAFEPVKHNDTTVCTNVWGDKVDGFGDNGLIIAPSKTVVKGATDYNAKAPVQHPDAGSVKVYDLNGNLNWKFRLGGDATNMSVKGNYLILGTGHNGDTMDYGYCGIYAFNLAQKGDGKEVDVTEESALDKYIGYYHTDGAIIYGCLDTSDDNKVICATTWPTRVGTEKHGKHSLYILKIK